MSFNSVFMLTNYQRYFAWYYHCYLGNGLFLPSVGLFPETDIAWRFAHAFLRADMKDVWTSLPTSLDPRDLVSNLTVIDTARRALENRDFTVGEEVKAEFGIEKHHPIILVPGIVSTGLESWGTEVVARNFFRKRLWVGIFSFILLYLVTRQTGYIDND